MIKNKKELELYIHIPFCVKKCAYCDFLSGPNSLDKIEEYVEALIREIGSSVTDGYNDSQYEVTSVFVGGGTPSILSPEQMKRIFKALQTSFSFAENAEITIEANPGTVTEEKLLSYRKCGINRISFGLQSANNEELKLLGRIHTYEAFLDSFHLARACGFENINVDLISAIPNQTPESFADTLRKIIALNPEHISAYSLIVEEGTPFAELYGEGAPREEELPSEEEERLIYQQTKALLESAGYYRYEISNYAKPGKECKHNLGYWERKEYLGFGIGAASLIHQVRYKNIDDLEDYIGHSADLRYIQTEIQPLSKKEQMEEFLFLGLRKMEGISKSEFKRLYGTAIESNYGMQIERFMREGLLQSEGECLKLSERGIDVSNYVFAAFLE